MLILLLHYVSLALNVFTSLVFSALFFYHVIQVRCHIFFLKQLFARHNYVVCLSFRFTY